MSHDSSPLHVTCSLDESGTIEPPVYNIDFPGVHDFLVRLASNQLTGCSQIPEPGFDPSSKKISQSNFFRFDQPRNTELETTGGDPNLWFAAFGVPAHTHDYLNIIFTDLLSRYDTQNSLPTTECGVAIHGNFLLTPTNRSDTKTSSIMGVVGYKSTKISFSVNPNTRPVTLDTDHRSRYDFSGFLARGSDAYSANRLSARLIHGYSEMVDKEIYPMNLYMIDAIGGVSSSQRLANYRQFLVFPFGHLGPHDAAKLFNKMINELSLDQRQRWPHEELQVDSMIQINWMQNGVMMTSNALVGTSLTSNI